MMAEFHLAQDSTREESLHLEEKNRELMEKQEYEIQLATLTERNRIARRYFWQCGSSPHSFSIPDRSHASCVEEQEELAAQLASIKTTLDDAMTNVRSSVHDLHENLWTCRWSSHA